jgi:putative CocE/NonD family hydrolase
MLRSMLIACSCLAVVQNAAAQQLNFPAEATSDPRRLDTAMAALAAQLSDSYPTADRATFLDNMFRVQILNADYEQAQKSLSELNALPRHEMSPQVAAARVPFAIFLQAKRVQAKDGLAFADAFTRAFRTSFQGMDNLTSGRVIRTLSEKPAALRDELQTLPKKSAAAQTLSTQEALQMVRLYQMAQMYESFEPLVPSLVAEDDARRYSVEKDVLIPTPDGAKVCLLVVRPRSGAQRLPALFDFTIYAQSDTALALARRTASNGFVAVEGYTRGKACSPGSVAPYEHDADDAATVIEWISRQAWSDGQVGMWSGSYGGFTQWAAAKRMPKALKAIMPMAAAAPGIDVPMEGNVFWNFVYPWPFYTTSNKLLDDATYNDEARWQRLNRNWYVSGRAYRDMPTIDGTPNPIWSKWIAHPTYDAYWQKLIPYERDFARINIPVLQTAGYYGGGPGAAVYYFTQHYKYNPGAQHYLVIGPYEHFEAQRGMIDQLGQAVPSSRGDRVDPAAVIDIAELRFQWFDYTLRGGSKPEILRDKVNYEVTGANVWKHAPSITAMSNDRLSLRFSALRADDGYRLTTGLPSSGQSVELEVDLADRSDADRTVPGGNIIDTAIDTQNGLRYVSDALPAAVEVTGLFSGHLELVSNKRDFDFQIQLYELTPQGEYYELAPYWSRASHVTDLSKRRLLTPGRRHVIDFKSVRLMGHRLQAGSRIVAVLSVIKGSDRQINYGSGKEVSEETSADAGAPLSIQWFDSSYLDIPIYQ